MKIKRRTKRRSHLLNDRQFSHPVALWALRILVDLAGWRSLSSGQRASACWVDSGILHTVGLTEFVDEEIDIHEMHLQLREALDHAESVSFRTDKTLRDNLQRLSSLVGMTSDERHILAFAATLHSHPGLRSVAGTLNELTTGEVLCALQAILQLPVTSVREALAPTGTLASSGLLSLERYVSGTLCEKLGLMDGLGEVLMEEQADVMSMLSGYFTAAPHSTLAREDFAHLEPDLGYVARYLNAALQDCASGVNILIYGPTGTGKTEFVRQLADSLECPLFEISCCDTDGDSLSGPARFNAYLLSQHILAHRQRTLVMFDEIEDIFPNDHSTLLFTLRRDDRNKARTNQVLESNPVSAIWVGNEIGQIDDAFIRRFDIVMELGTPPQSVRRKMLAKHLADIPISPKWMDRAAQHRQLTPAIISGAAHVARRFRGAKAQEIERLLERLINNKLRAMGNSEKLARVGRNALTYRQDLINADQDLELLIASLQRNRHGRLCLYGPPGTGKTEFAHHLARTLEMPLLIRRGSDLLGKYVGQTEQAIATMFHEAESEGALLLLDEADSFLRERRGAEHTWELTQVNEVLTQMEAFEGVFLCSTNLIDTLDSAAVRRFDLHIKLGYLVMDQIEKMFHQMLVDFDIDANEGAEWRTHLARLNNITPGDFATVMRRTAMIDAELTAESLLHLLVAEIRFKNQRTGSGIGFSADIY